MMDLAISVCLESSGTCMLVVTVLDGSLIPKTACDWSSGLQGNTVESSDPVGIQITQEFQTTMKFIIYMFHCMETMKLHTNETVKS